MSQQCGETLVSLFETRARLSRENVAVIYDGGRDKQNMSYAQLLSAMRLVCIHSYSFISTTVDKTQLCHRAKINVIIRNYNYDIDGRHS